MPDDRPVPRLAAHAERVRGACRGDVPEDIAESARGPFRWYARPPVLPRRARPCLADSPRRGAHREAPCMVLRHGFSAVKERWLDRYASCSRRPAWTASSTTERRARRQRLGAGQPAPGDRPLGSRSGSSSTRSPMPSRAWMWTPNESGWGTSSSAAHSEGPRSPSTRITGGCSDCSSTILPRELVAEECSSVVGAVPQAARARNLVEKQVSRLSLAAQSQRPAVGGPRHPATHRQVESNSTRPTAYGRRCRLTPTTPTCHRG